MTSPASSDPATARPADPRQADVDSVTAMLGRAAAGEPVGLAVLSAAELCALGAMHQTLIDAGPWAWWTGTTAARRAALTASLLRGLASRDLLGPPGPGAQAGMSGPGGLAVRPRLGLILAGRTRPAWIAIRSEAHLSAADPLRMYGLADQARGLRAVLAERVTRQTLNGGPGPAYLYVLISPGRAASTLARWAARTPGGPGEEDPPKLIRLYRAGSGILEPSEQIEVQAGRDGLRVACPPAAQPLTCSQDAVQRLLAAIMTGSCR